MLKDKAINHIKNGEPFEIECSNGSVFQFRVIILRCDSTFGWKHQHQTAFSVDKSETNSNDLINWINQDNVVVKRVSPLFLWGENYENC